VGASIEMPLPVFREGVGYRITQDQRINTCKFKVLELEAEVRSLRRTIATNDSLISFQDDVIERREEKVEKETERADDNAKKPTGVLTAVLGISCVLEGITIGVLAKNKSK
jgi:hypothetical protein